eukprot:415276-Lingulodinium_polyedra.AAC.1
MSHPLRALASKSLLGTLAWKCSNAQGFENATSRTRATAGKRTGTHNETENTGFPHMKLRPRVHAPHLFFKAARSSP